MFSLVYAFLFRRISLDIFAGRHAGVFLECCREVCLVGEAHGIGYLRYVHALAFEQLLGLAHAQVAQEFAGREACHGF